MRESGGSRLNVAMVMVISGALLEGVGLLLLAPIFKLLIGGSDALASWIEGGRSELLILFAAGFILAMAARAYLFHRRDVMLWEISARLVEEIRNRAVRALADARWSDVAKLQHARIVNLLSGEANRVMMASQTTAQIAATGFLLAVQCVVALILAPAFAASVLVVLAIIGLAMVLRRSRARAIGVALNKAGIAMFQNLSALLGGLKAAKAQDQERAFVGEFVTLQERTLGHQLDFTRSHSRIQMIFGIAAAATAAGLIGIGTLVFSVPAAEMIALLAVLARLATPAMTLQQSIRQLSYDLPAFESMRAIGRELLPERAPATVRVDPPAGPIRFEGVTYLHDGGGGVRDTDLVIAPGEMVGLTGPSGCGKTTLLDLAVGLLEPQAGQILIGGVPLDDASLESWRAQIGYATQDPFLFHDSVRRNLDWSGSVGEADLWAALEAAGAGDLVRALPRGLETQIGERGGLLSGGERQRLTLARAILRKPRLLVLDEATAAMDVALEQRVLAGLRAQDNRPAVLIVAHRSESLAWCDRVLTVEAGRLLGAA